MTKTVRTRVSRACGSRFAVRRRLHAKQKRTYRHRESAWEKMRAEVLADKNKTATHRPVSPVSDPSELGSDPDGWLEYRNLRTGKMIQIVRTRVSRNCGSRSAVSR